MVENEAKIMKKEQSYRIRKRRTDKSWAYSPCTQCFTLYSTSK